MDNRFLYEETVNVLIDLLKKTIADFSVAHETACEYYNSQPLFSITSSKLSLLKNISHFSNYQIRNEIASLCYKMYSKNNFNKCIESAVEGVDFIGIDNGRKIGYRVSMAEQHMPDMENAQNAGIDNLVIIVLKSDLTNLPPNSMKYCTYKDKYKVKNVTLKDFFECMCPSEYETFQEYIGRFNYEAEILLGLTISPIPTKTALEGKRIKIQEEFATCFFEKYLMDYFNEEEIKTLKINFTKSIFSQMPKADFTDSLMSSEWYYDLYVSTDGEMEQTAIVAGYLKSIEQLLFSMMLSKCDKLEFKLRTKKSNKNNEKFIPLTKDNYTNLLTMAGSLLMSIDVNYGKSLEKVYIDASIGRKTQKFLHDYFEHTRNGYFHKDNIYTWNEIKQIRKETYCAYFLIAGSFL